jgi:hypothetical protein
VTIRRLGIGLVDDELSCIACATPTPAEPWQHQWPIEAAGLGAQADRLLNDTGPVHASAGVTELRRQADEIDAKIKKGTAPAWLCEPCRVHLHLIELRQAWLGGRHAADDAALIERTRRYLHHPSRQPGNRGACLDCRPSEAVTREAQEAPA